MSKAWKDSNTLEEQVYKKLTPKYWHGSAYKVWNKDLSYWKCFYMSTSFEYALTYAHKENRDFGYMYSCKLKRELNIFNPLSTRDFYVLVKYLCGNISDKDTVDFVSKMRNSDWLSLFGEKQRNSLLEDLKELGYDGFFNYEGDAKVGTKPAMGIFDESDIEIVDILDAEDIRDIISSDHVMSNHKEEQRRAYLRGDIDENSMWRKISLLEHSDFTDRPDREKLKKELNERLKRREIYEKKNN